MDGSVIDKTADCQRSAMPRRRKSTEAVEESPVKAVATEQSDQKTEWTAVYPLPPLAGLAKQVVTQRLFHSSKEPSESFCTFDANEAVGACWLCTATELPSWHFRHRRVEHGYRKCRSFNAAVWSLFQWHNETVNIWSHLLGCLILMWRVHVAANNLSEYTMSTLPPSSSLFAPVFLPSWFIPVLTVCLFFGNVVPILSSAFCHTFYCISPTWHRICWFTDFVGLMLGVLGITTGYLLIALTSCPGAWNSFVTLEAMVVLGWLVFTSACFGRYLPRLSAAVLVPNDRFPEFAANMSKFSAWCFTLSTASTLWLCPFYLTEPPFQIVMRNVCLFPVSLALSILIFAQGGVPERFTSVLRIPAHTFDYLGHSHQFWHVASWTVLYLWISVVEQHFVARLQRGCPMSL